MMKKVSLQHRKEKKFMSKNMNSNGINNPELQKGLGKLNVLGFNLKILRHFGILIDYSRLSTRWEMLLYFILQCITIFLHAQHCILTMIGMYILRDRPQDVGDGFIFLLSHIKNVMKLGTMIVYRTKFICLFNFLDKNYVVHQGPHTNTELSLLGSYMHLTKRLAKYVWISYALTTSSIYFNTPPRPKLDVESNSTISGEHTTIRRESVMKEWMPFQAVETPYFELVTAYELLAMTVYFACVTLMNITFLALIIYTTAQFAVLANALQQIRMNVVRNFSNLGNDIVSPAAVDIVGINTELSETTQDSHLENRRLTDFTFEGAGFPHSPETQPIRNTSRSAYCTDALERCWDKALLFHEAMLAYLKQCIEHHQTLLEYSKLLDEALRPVMFMQLLCTAVLLAFIGVLLSSATDSAQSIRAISFLGYVFMEFGTICWIATELQIQSEKVGQAILLSEYYNESTKFQKNIPLIVMRTQRPVRLSAGPFGSLSLELFATVLNSAYSYFTILREVTRE